MTESSPVVSLVRETVEYEAAFDLELWKVEERNRFQLELQKERVQLIDSLERLYVQKDVARLEEIDGMRRDLEAMGQRLQQAGAVLQKRLLSQEKREDAMNQRRRLLSEEHEEHLRRMEARHRSALEESSLRQHQLEGVLKDRESTNQQLELRLHRSLREYDVLQRAVAQMQSRERGSVEAVAELTTAAEHLRQVTKSLQDQIDSKDTLLKVASTDLQAALAEIKRYKEKLADVSSKYKTLKAQCTHQQEQWLSMERERLLADMNATKHPVSVAHHVPYLQQPQSVSEVQELRQLVIELRHEEEQKENNDRQKIKSKKQGRNHSSRNRKVPLLYVERNHQPVVASDQPRVDASSKPPKRETDNISVSTMSSTEDYSAVPEPNNTTNRGTDSILDGEETFDYVSTASTYHSVSFSQLLSSQGQPEDEDGVMTVQGSFHRTLRPHGPALTNVLSPFEAVALMPGDSTNRTPSARDSLGSVFGSPAQSPFPTAGPANRHHTADVIRPYVLPSAQSSVDALPGGTSTDSSLGGEGGVNQFVSQLPDLQKFLRQLKANRDRLVESGVYEATDPLVVEMDSKIMTYHRYLAMNFAVPE